MLAQALRLSSRPRSRAVPGGPGLARPPVRPTTRRSRGAARGRRRALDGRALSDHPGRRRLVGRSPIAALHARAGWSVAGKSAQCAKLGSRLGNYSACRGMQNLRRICFRSLSYSTNTQVVRTRMYTCQKGISNTDRHRGSSLAVHLPDTHLQSIEKKVVLRASSVPMNSLSRS